MIVKVDFNFDADYMYCPDHMDLEALMKQFNHWIDDATVAHPFWVDENHLALCYRADAIAYWLNAYVLKNSDKPAEVLEEMVREDKAYDYAVVL